MINKRYQDAYAEVMYYLNGIELSDVLKIPKDLILHFEKFKNPYYVCNFDYTRPLKELNVLEETKGLIGMICLNYWCDTIEMKQQLLNGMNENELKYQEELKKIYNVDNIFKKSNDEKNVQEKSLVEVKEKNFFIKLLDKIRKIFNKSAIL